MNGKVRKITSSHTKKQTVIIAEQDIPEQELKDVVAKAGYNAVSESGSKDRGGHGSFPV